MTPRYIRCYDNGGETFDRYTVVFTGRYRSRTGGDYLYLAMSTNPFHPQGFGQTGFSDHIIDKPRYSHLGKKIKFEDLPGDCRTHVINFYNNLWNLNT